MPQATELIGQPLCLFAAAAVHHHVGTRGAQRQGDRPTDSLRGSGYDRRASRKFFSDRLRHETDCQL
jgi:hypothetical protein